ncbi:MAG: HAD family hydrolase [Candidatus Aenigmatarchaeota archaeon]
MPEIRALIFDLDGTLLDFYAFKRAASRAAVAAMIKHGLKADRKKAEQLMWRMYFEYGFEYRSIFQEFLKKVGHDPNDLRMIAAAVVAYREARAHALKAYPAVKPTLRALKKRGYVLCIVTDAPALKAWIRLASTCLENEFDAVITKDDTGSLKKTGKPLAFALKRLGLEPAEVMVIGDSGSSDIAPAKALGIRTAMTMYGRRKPPSVKADYELRSIRDLLKVCK